MRPELPPLPPLMRNLPIDDRGYPVPWFVAWVTPDGDPCESTTLHAKPEFRAADGRKFGEAVSKSLCWVCGNHVGPHFTFVIGPMCAVNRNTAEPPCHLSCAEFSAKGCPFLSKPHMVRRENDLPDGIKDPGGFMIRRNPGVTCLWTCRGFQLHSGGKLFRLMEPHRVDWYAEGRPATREEILASIQSGLPLLRKQCSEPSHHAELEKMFSEAQAFLPVESA